MSRRFLARLNKGQARFAHIEAEVAQGVFKRRRVGLDKEGVYQRHQAAVDRRCLGKFTVDNVVHHLFDLLAHKMGVVDQDYIDKSGDTNAVLGRKIGVQAEEVIQLADVLGIMAGHLTSSLEQKP